MTPARKKEFFETLQKRFPNADTELHFSTPFQLMVAVIMSAQTTDRQVNKVTEPFFSFIKTPRDLAALSFEERMPKIRAVNFYNNKSKNIYKLAQIMSTFVPEHPSDAMQKIYDERGYWIPDDLHALMEWPGIGEKTAKVLLRNIYDQHVVAVDTHIHRVANRVGLVKTHTPLQTSSALEKEIPKQYLFDAHHTILLFGRYHCKALKPLCPTCPFASRCPARPLYYPQLPTP